MSILPTFDPYFAADPEVYTERAATDLTEAGYAVIDGFLAPATVQLLREFADQGFEDGDFKAAGIGRQDDYQLNRAIRGDHIRWLDPAQPHPTVTPFFDQLQELLQYLNRRLFLGLRDLEMHLAIYPAGSFYRRHLDVFKQGVGRKLSIVCYLNQAWTPEDGGQLRLYLKDENGAEQPLDIAPLGGRLVIFLSEELEHEVLLAHRQRYSITGWARDQVHAI